jgi:hypothetical protein
MWEIMRDSPPLQACYGDQMLDDHQIALLAQELGIDQDEVRALAAGELERYPEATNDMLIAAVRQTDDWLRAELSGENESLS